MTNKQAIEYGKKWDEAIESRGDTPFSDARQFLSLAIKALGERTQGEWIPSEETYTDLSGTIETYTRFQCDRCMQGQNFGPYPFCPWCGSKMTPEISEETTI
jgi:hypothetical protein